MAPPPAWQAPGYSAEVDHESGLQLQLQTQLHTHTHMATHTGNTTNTHTHCSHAGRSLVRARAAAPDDSGLGGTRRGLRRSGAPRGGASRRAYGLSSRPPAASAGSRPHGAPGVAAPAGPARVAGLRRSRGDCRLHRSRAGCRARCSCHCHCHCFASKFRRRRVVCICIRCIRIERRDPFQRLGLDRVRLGEEGRELRELVQTAQAHSLPGSSSSSRTGSHLFRVPCPPPRPDRAATGCASHRRSSLRGPPRPAIG